MISRCQNFAESSADACSFAVLGHWFHCICGPTCSDPITDGFSAAIGRQGLRPGADRCLCVIGLVSFASCIWPNRDAEASTGRVCYGDKILADGRGQMEEQQSVSNSHVEYAFQCEADKSLHRSMQTLALFFCKLTDETHQADVQLSKIYTGLGNNE